MSVIVEYRVELVLMGLAAMSVLLGRLIPRVAVVLWAAVLVFVPYWISLDMALAIPMSVLASAGLVLVTVRRGFVPRPMDWVLVLFLLLLAISVIYELGRTDEFIVFLFGPLVAYAAGRTVTMSVPPQLIYKALGSIFVALAVLAITESMTGYNPFIATGPENTLSDTWAGQRIRGGQVRAEASFGSSIALGASIALTIPLVWAARWPVWWRAVAITLLATAAFLSISRIAMVTTVLTLLTMAVLSRHRLSWRHASWVLVLPVPLLAVGIVALQRVFETAGTEASDSAAYRVGLQGLIPSMEWLGISDSLFVSAQGARYFGGFRSIDSELILGGLLHGLLPLAVLLAPLLVGLFIVLAGKASVPLIAVVCQVPALFNVALITQYEVYFWFLVGLAATLTTGRAEAVLHRQRCADHRRPDQALGHTDALSSPNFWEPPCSRPHSFNASTTPEAIS